jgi:hypothetical protein
MCNHIDTPLFLSLRYNRLTEAPRVVSEDSSRLAEVLIEILAAATGDVEIVGWRCPALEIPRVGLHTRDRLRDAA